MTTNTKEKQSFLSGMLKNLISKMILDFIKFTTEMKRERDEGGEK